MTRTRRLRTLTAVALASAALVVAGCGGDDDAATTTAPVATATTGTQTAEAGTTSGTIVDVAAGNEDFSILVAAVQRAGLAETLSGPGPFTVFAPTNAAFEQALGDLGITQEELLESPALARILTYHVLPARVGSGDVTGALSPETVEGSEVQVRPENGQVRVGDATVVQADVDASNGVIHAIDRVLIPPDVDLG